MMNEVSSWICSKIQIRVFSFIVSFKYEDFYRLNTIWMISEHYRNTELRFSFKFKWEEDIDHASVTNSIKVYVIIIHWHVEFYIYFCMGSESHKNCIYVYVLPVGCPAWSEKIKILLTWLIKTTVTFLYGGNVVKQFYNWVLLKSGTNTISHSMTQPSTHILCNLLVSCFVLFTVIGLPYIGSPIPRTMLFTGESLPCIYPMAGHPIPKTTGCLTHKWVALPCLVMKLPLVVTHPYRWSCTLCTVMVQHIHWSLQ
jgi:hypothetical protein